MKKLFVSSVGFLMTLALVMPSLVPTMAQAQTASDFCYTFNQNLRYGSSGTAVVALQTALEQNLGISLSADQPSDSSVAGATAHFADATAAAVVQFQEKYASDILAPSGLTNGTGYVGAATRAKLNSLFGCGSNPSPITTRQPSQPTQCPIGFMCTPVVVNPAPTCPPGFTCMPITNPTNPTPPVTPVSSPAPVSYPTGNLTGSAALSLDASSPLGATTQTSALPVLTFDLMAQSGTESLSSVTAHISLTGLLGNISNAYLYQGSTQIASASVQNGIAQFTSLPSVVLNPNVYYVFTVKVDLIPNAQNVVVTASVGANDVRLVNTSGVFVNVSGSANGSPITVNGPINTAPVSSAAGSSLTLALDPSSPLSQSVAVTNASNESYLGLPILTFDIQTPTSFTLNGLGVNIPVTSASNPNTYITNVAATAYLYQGNTQIASSAVTNGSVYFNNISLTGGSNTAFTVKVDVTNITTPVSLFGMVIGNLKDQNGNYVTINSGQSPRGSSITISPVNH